MNSRNFFPEICRRIVSQSLQAWIGECSSPECPRRSSRKRLLPHTTVRLEERSFCANLCLARAIEQRLLECRAKPHFSRTHRVPLGLLMMERGWLSPAQLQAGLALQRRRGGRLGNCLRALDFAGEDHITAVLAMQWSCPVLNSTTSIDIAVLSLLPRRVLENNRIIPVHFSRAKSQLSIAFTAGIDYEVLNCVGKMLGCSTEACLTSESIFQEQLCRLLGHAQREITFNEKLDAGSQANILLSYAHRLTAQQIRIARCGETVWARIDARGSYVDVVFDCLSQGELA